MEFLEKALQKIQEQRKKTPKGMKARAVLPAVADALAVFAGQDEEFAQAIVQSDKTLADCGEEITRDIGQSCSDLEIYRRAVAAYFPGAGIDMQMTINLCASVDGESWQHTAGADHSDAAGRNKAAIVLDLTDFL